MTRSQNDLDDLKDLQREAAELREKRKRSHGKETHAKDDHGEEDEKPKRTRSSKSTPESEDESSAFEEEDASLVVRIESVIQELDVLATKHPALALASAFTAGFLAGKLFFRR